MSGARIFVSYSHRDVNALERLRIFVRPLEREDLLSAWDDTSLAGGDDWGGEIAAALEAATISVLLISQDFLSSEFIARHEVPRILARHAKGDLTVMPVFLNHSLVRETSYSFVDPQGQTKTAWLTQFQGYGTPDRPLAALRGPLREEQYKELGRRLLALAKADRGEPASPALAPVAARSTPPAVVPAKSYELSVGIERRDGRLEVSYRLSGGPPFGQWPLSWGEVRQRAGATAAALDGAAPLPPEGAWGEEMWQILFGPAERWQPVLRALFDRTGEAPQPHPTWAPVRLRIATEEPVLAGLPWRWTSWQRQLLLDFGWTFSMTSTADLAEPAADVQTTAPSRVLLVLPQAGDDWGPYDSAHESALREVFAQVWPTGQKAGYLDVARTRAEVAAGLRERPHLLYIYARCTEGGLLLEGAAGAELLAFADLRRLFGEAGHTPRVLYLNTAGTGGPEPVELHLAQIPLVIGRRRARWDDGSPTTALRWLRRWLEAGEDPVVALHEVLRSNSVSGDDPATLWVRARYRTWRTSLYQGAPARRSPSLQVDRDTQKALVRKHVEELARDRHRRVMALIPFAAPGNSLVSLQVQLRHDLEQSLAPLADIRWLRLALPIELAWQESDLEEDLKIQLGAGSRETVAALLRRHAPQAVAPGHRALLWLDWGTCGEAPALPARPGEDQLADWLRFAGSFLATHCPDDLRLVCSLALELPASQHDKFARRLQDLRRELRSPVFRLSDLPPLGEVSEDHLLEYLVSSTCGAEIQAEVADRIVAKTSGQFEETVALLEGAESGSWYDLLARLRREQGDGKPR